MLSRFSQRLAKASPWTLYVGLVGAAGVSTLLWLPILALDNDLWYHLAHGRYFYAHLEIPHDSYFSFIEPVRERIDYFWLFQVLIFTVFRAFDYLGLILLRATLFGLFLWGVAKLVAPLRESARYVWYFPAFLFALVACHNFFRYTLVRPHTLTYLLLVWCLVALESRGRAVWALPALAVLWTNFHGVAFPVLWLVCGAYGLEILWTCWRQKAWPQGHDRHRLIAASVAMAAPLLTPHGPGLLSLPFLQTYFAAGYIGELAPRPVADHLQAHLSLRGWSLESPANLVLVWALVTALGSVVRGRLRIAHLALFVGAILLLLRAARFTHEMTVLVLPLIAAYGPLWRVAEAAEPSEEAPAAGWSRNAAAWLLVGLLLATPFGYFASFAPASQEAYPLPQRGLPHGVASFLAAQPAEGKVMNYGNFGGYLQWALPERYRIFINMEIPLFFLDQDLFEVTAAFQDPIALARFLGKYQPEFIAAPLTVDYFPQLLAAYPDYRPVFFDDTLVLFADRRRFPELATKFELQQVRPTLLAKKDLAALHSALGFEPNPELLQKQRLELERLESFDDKIVAVELALAWIDLKVAQPQKALERAERALAQEPSLVAGHALRGEALRQMAKLELAVAAFEKGLDLSPTGYERGFLLRALAGLHVQRGDFTAAYHALEQALGRFNTEAPAADLVQLAALAERAGLDLQARQWLEFAAFKIPPGDRALGQRVAEVQRALARGD